MALVYMIEKSQSQPEPNGRPPDLPDAVYWPFERLPESKLEVCAMACVETVLKHSEEAQGVYVGIVLSWALPGCQALIEDFTQCKQDARVWLRNRAKAVVKNEPPPDWPNAWIEVIVKFKDNTDFHKLLMHVHDFIMLGFNRKVDLENQTPKLLPGNSLYLVRAIHDSSLLDYLAEKPELRGPRVMPNGEVAKLHWFCHTLASNSTARKGREIKHTIVQTLRHEQFTLSRYQTMLDGAEMWYRARVFYNTAREAADYYNIDPIDLSKRIEPYDDATGWPRHR